jgi:predicted extracellular nuclease
MTRILVFVSVFCLFTGGALAQTSDLLISEYVEGSSNNKALEIFNGTEDVIDLGSYTIERYTNGSTTSVSIPLGAVSLDPGDTWVITHNLASAELLALADQTDGNLNFNGDDSLVLTFAGTQVVDSFGRVGEDPGDFWSCDDGNTQNHTMRRLSSVCNGDTITDDEFDPCLEWSFFASDVFTGLGTHIADCGAVGNSAPTWGSLKASFR